MSPRQSPVHVAQQHSIPLSAPAPPACRNRPSEKSQLDAGTPRGRRRESRNGWCGRVRSAVRSRAGVTEGEGTGD
nr:hypothetical protein CFP56_09672 [Quercus suber]